MKEINVMMAICAILATVSCVDLDSGESNATKGSEAFYVIKNSYNKTISKYNSESDMNDNKPAHEWYYEDDNLKEYSIYDYTITDIISINIYDTANVAEITPSRIIYNIIYNLDASGNVTKGYMYEKTSSDNPISFFTATYNNKGNYLTYLSQNRDGSVSEHREVSYDEIGLNYLTETYYDSVTASPSNVIAKYNCYYDDTYTDKYIKETKYEKVPLDNIGKTFKDSTCDYKFEWKDISTDYSPYMQACFNTKGVLSSTITYKYDGVPYSSSNLVTKSYSEGGATSHFIEYTRDDTGFKTSERYYNVTAKGNILNYEIMYKKYRDDSYYIIEKETITYNYTENTEDDETNANLAQNILEANNKDVRYKSKLTIPKNATPRHFY